MKRTRFNAKPRAYQRCFWAIFGPDNDLYPGSLRTVRCNAMDHVTKGSGKAWLELLDKGYTCRRIQVKTIDTLRNRPK